MNQLVQIIHGDCRLTLPTLAPESAQCCVTSPPYWGLRSYLPKDHPDKALEIGQEKTPELYVETMVNLFREIRRTLKPDGTVWLNLGDSYCGSMKGIMPDGSYTGGPKQRTNEVSILPSYNDNVSKRIAGLKPKDLIGIPWRVALALQSDGWYLRSDIIWAKPNCMPESVTDRPTRSHEYIFLLSKSERYFYDHESIKEPAISGDARKPYAPGQVDYRGSGHDRNGGKIRESVKRGGFNGKTNEMKGRESFRAIQDWRNKRSVWTIPPAQYRDAHFAVFPPNLIKPCVLAGSRHGDTILDPFGGSGTTGQVAIELGRKVVLCELNEKYISMIRERTAITPGLAI